MSCCDSAPRYENQGGRKCGLDAELHSMVLPGRALRAALAASLLAGSAGVGALHEGAARAATLSVPGPTPKAQCGPGSDPETGTQGRVSTADVTSGRAGRGYTCNMKTVSHYGRTGGFKVFRYNDTAGHECAFCDSTRLLPTV